MNPNTRRAREARVYIDAAKANNGALLLLFGETGMGKTFFLRRLREAAESTRSGPIHVATADEFEAEISYSFIERLLSTGGPSPVTIDPDSNPNDVARLALASLTPLPAPEIRTILLDDVQWVDPASERVLRYLAPRLAGQGVFLVLASKPPLAPESLFAHLHDQAQVHSNWHCIEFMKLSVTDIREMALERFGTGISMKTAKRIQTLTDGAFSRVSAVFDELTPHEVEGLHLRSDLPVRLHQKHGGERLVPAYLELSPEGRLAVEIVALSEQTLEVMTVKAASQALDREIDIAEAVEHSLLSEVDFGESLAPAHPLLPATLLDLLEREQTGAVFEALASLSSGHQALLYTLRSASSWSDELAEQVRNDVAASLAENNLRAANETLRRCLDLATGTERDDLLIDLVLHHLRHKSGFLVLDLLPEIEALPETPLRECIAILLRIYRFEEQAPRERIDALLSLDDPSADLRTIQAFVSFLSVISVMRSRDAERLTQLIPRAKQHWAEAPVSAAELTDQRLAWMVAPREYELILDSYSLVPLSIACQNSTIEQLLPSFVERLQALQPSEHKIDVIVALAGAAMAAGDVAQAHELAHAGYTLLDGRPRPWAGGGVRVIYAHTLALTNNLAEAQQVVKTSEEKAYEYLDVEVRLTMAALRGWIAALTDTEDPAPHLLGAQRLYTLHWEGYGIDLVLLAEVEVAALAMKPREVILLTEPERYTSFTTSRHSFLTYRAHALIDLGRFDEAEALIRHLSEQRDISWNETHGTLAWLEARVRDAKRAEMPPGHDNGSHPNTVQALYETAIEQTETPLYLARTLRDYAEFLAQQGEPAAAAGVFARASSIFTTIGARRDLGILAERVGNLNASAEADHHAAIESLTPREREIAEYLADGRSTQEIASQLVISPATVRFHVSNVLTKLGLSSRGEIARHLRGPLSTQ